MSYLLHVALSMYPSQTASFDFESKLLVGPGANQSDKLLRSQTIPGKEASKFSVPFWLATTFFSKRLVVTLLGMGRTPVFNASLLTRHRRIQGCTIRPIMPAICKHSLLEVRKVPFSWHRPTGL